MAKKITTYIINFFLVVIVLLLIALIILSNTILNKQYVQGILKKKDYYQRMYSSIEKEFKYHTMQSGLEDDIVENLYDLDKVTNDIDMVVEALYENKDINIDVETISQTLDNRINKILEEHNRKPGTDEKEAIKTFEDAIADTYANGISYSEKAVKGIGETISKIKPILTYAKIALFIVTLALGIAIIAINRNIREIIKIFGVALLAVGILNISIKIFIGNRANKILVLNKTFSQSLIELINSVVNVFLIVGIIASIMGIVAIILQNIKKKEVSE